MEMKFVLGWALLGLATVQGLSLWNSGTNDGHGNGIDNFINPLISIISALKSVDDIKDEEGQVFKVNENKTKIGRDNKKSTHNHIPSSKQSSYTMYPEIRKNIISFDEVIKKSKDERDSRTHSEKILGHVLQFHRKPGHFTSEQIVERKTLPQIFLFPVGSINEEVDVYKKSEKNLFQSFTGPMSSSGKRDQESNEHTKTKENEKKNKNHVDTVFNINTVNINEDEENDISVAGEMLNAADILAGKDPQSITFNINTVNVGVDDEKNVETIENEVKSQTKAPCGKEMEIIPGEVKEQPRTDRPFLLEDPMERLKEIFEKEGAQILGKDKISVVYNKTGRYLSLQSK